MGKYEKFIRNAKALIAQGEKGRPALYDDFNIFIITERAQFEESTHCRFLYELLSPTGAHRQGDRFLRLFFQHVLGKPYPAKPLHVVRELPIDTESRIDLCIYNDDCCYPIEAKVYAEEQARQMERYCRWASAQSGESQAFFLTLNGHVARTAGAYEQMVTPISFAAHVMRWVEACCKAVRDIPQLYEPIYQYAVLLKRLTGRKGGELMDEIKRQIEASPADFEAAQAISQALEAAKAEMMKRVFSDLETHLSRRLQVIHSNYESRAYDYYALDKNGLDPRIAFLLQCVQDACLALRVQVDERLYIGMTLYRKMGNGGYTSSKITMDGLADEVAALTPAEHAEATNWFYWSKPLCYQGDRLDFRQCTGVYQKLYDDAEYPRIMEELYRQIDECLDEIGVATQT